MKELLCKVFGHKFKYVRRYYRCVRCGVRRCDIMASDTASDLTKGQSSMVRRAQELLKKEPLVIPNTYDHQSTDIKSGFGDFKPNEEK